MKGIGLISVLVALFLLLVGVMMLARVMPALGKLSGRSKDTLAVSLLADRIFAVMEEAYGCSSGPPVPPFLRGVESDYPGYPYAARFDEIRDGMYRVELEIRWKREGNDAREAFYHVFRRK